MLRDPQNIKSRYGYVQTTDVPLTKNVSEEKQSDTLLQTAGKMVLGMASMYVAGRMLRSGVADLLEAAPDVMSMGEKYGPRVSKVMSWFKNRLDEVEEFDKALKYGEGVFDYSTEFDRAGQKTGRVAWDEVIPKEEKHGADYMRKVLVSRASAMARALPYEIPAAYLTNRLLLDREQLKEDIRSGKLNPRSPLDWASDFSQQAVTSVTTELMFRAAGPMVSQLNQTMQLKSQAYDKAAFYVKAVNAEQLKWIGQQSDRAHVVAKAWSSASEKTRAAIEANPTAFSPGEDLSLGDFAKKVNPFNSRSWKHLSETYNRFAKAELPKAMNQYEQIGTRASGEHLVARIVRDVSDFDREFAIHKTEGEVTGFGTFGKGVLVGQYQSRLVDELTGLGIDRKTAFQVVKLKATSANERTISGAILRASESDKDLRPDIADQFFELSEWSEEEISAALKSQGVRGRAISRDQFVQAARKAVPSRQTAQEWKAVATSRTQEMRERAFRDFVERRSAPQVIDSVRDLARNPEGREELADRVLGVMGRQGITGKGTSFSSFAAATGTNDLQAARVLTALGVSRKVAVTNALNQFNFLGVRRMTLAELREMDARRPETDALGRRATGIEIGTRTDKKHFRSGLDFVEERLGHTRVGNLNADSGLYRTIGNDVVDLRELYRSLRNIRDSAFESFKLPIVQFKPAQVLGLTEPESEGPAFRSMPVARNHAAYAENPDIDVFSPSAYVRGRVYTYSKSGEFSDIGRWKWHRADRSTSVTKAARIATGYPRTPVRRPDQMRFITGGRFLLPEDMGGTEWGYRLGQRFPIIQRAINEMSVEQDTSDSLTHRISQRISRSVDFRAFVANQKWFQAARAKYPRFDRAAQALFFDPSKSAVKEDFLPTRWQHTYIDPVAAGLKQRKLTDAEVEQSIYGARDAAKTLRSPARSVVQEVRRDIAQGQGAGGFELTNARTALRKETQAVLEREYSAESNRTLSELITTVARGARIGKAFGPSPTSEAESLRSARIIINDLAGNKDLLTRDQRDSLTGLLRGINKGAAGDLSTARARASLHSKINQAYIQITAMSSGENGEKVLQELETAVRRMAAEGGGTHAVEDQMLAAIAAARLRMAEGGTSVADIDYLRTIGVSVPEALKRVAGPSLSSGMEGVRTTFSSRQIYAQHAVGGKFADKVRGIREVYRYTFGNKNWLYPEDLIDEDLPKTIKPFAGSRWIGVRPITTQLGITDSLSSFGKVLSGKSDTTYEERTHPGDSAAGVLFGDQKFKVGNGYWQPGQVNSGTLSAWHMVNRVASVGDELGIGLDPTQFKSPIDYMIRGLMLKRALPIYGAIQIMNLGLGIPIIGKNGIIGAGAWAIGPGLGQARAAAVTAVGGNDFFNTAADVMSLDEEARLRKWGRTPEEEQRYWDTGVDPIRSGRFWLLGTKPFKGDKVDYYRPNWYRMFSSDYQYTSDFKGNRLEWAMFGTDVSPGKYIDPYHYERKWGSNRPYPMSGDLFTGPWGPLTPALNATLGRVIKPKIRMHANLTEEYRDALVTAVVNARGIPETQQDAVVLKYKSGRIKISDLMVEDADAGQRLALTNETQKRIAGGGGGGEGGLGNLNDVGENDRILAAQYAIDAMAGTTGPGMGGYTSRAVSMAAALNRYIQAKSGERYVSLRGGASAKGMIPGTGMPILTPRRYDFDTQQVINPQETITGSSTAFRLGEFGYLTQEWGGIYGFGGGTLHSMFGMGTKDFTPDTPVLQGAERGYSAERSFWDQDLGGLGDVIGPWKTNLQLSEILRRFIPHRRHDIVEYNPIPNRMPGWLPTSDTYFMDFSTGDPYTKVKLGEARLPGKGYERLNDLHPDAFGEYGAFDRFKILADVAPWSREYRYYRDLLVKSDISPEMQKEAGDIKRQVAERKKKVILHPRKWDGKLSQLGRGELIPVPGDPNLYTMEGIDSPIRLAGVRFSKSPEGLSAARTFYETYVKGRSLELLSDANRGPENNREKTYDVIAKHGGRNLNRMLSKRAGKDGSGISLSTSTKYVDSLVKFGPGWQTLGKTWEAFAHLDIPFKNKIISKRTADEYYERKQVYGKIWQPWETPIKSFLEPFTDSATKPSRGILAPIVAGVSVGFLAGGFVDRFTNPGAYKFARWGGAIAGVAMASARLLSSWKNGQNWVPKRRRREWAIDEYADIINYVKYSNLYEQTRQRAIEEEGLDVEAWSQGLQASARGYKDKFRKLWDSAPVGKKPDKPESEKSLESLGPIAALAMEYKKRKESTMYGADVNGDIMNLMYSLPKRYRDVFQDLVETPKDKQKGLLDSMPRLMRRVFEAQWGLELEKKPEISEYFKRHELPGPDWEGWLPEVNVDEIKMKIINHEGLDAAEFGIFPTQMEAALSSPWAYPEYHSKTPMSRNQIEEYLTSMGVEDVQVDIQYGKGLSGFDMDLMHDRRMDIRGMING